MRFGADRSAVVTAIVLTLTVSAARAETTFRQRAEYFDISGFVDSRKEMWNAIRDWGPSGTSGKLIVGTAQPRFGYSYKFKKQGGRCYVKDLKVTVGVVLRLPEWNAKGLAKPELQRYFDCVLRTVTVHEKRHGKIAYETGQQIERTLLTELDGSSCKGYKARANSIFHRVIGNGRTRQNDFDRRDYARRRYQQCYNSDGPQVDLNANSYRQSSARRRPPTRRFDVEEPRRQSAQQRKQKQAHSQTEPESKLGQAAASIKTVSSALGGFRFAALLGSLVCAVFGIFLWWAARHERNKEFGFSSREANIAIASANSGSTTTEGRRTRSAPSRQPKAGFGKRSTRR